LNDVLNFFLNQLSGAFSGFPIAIATCGNGAQDDGETAATCPDDFADLGTCGNNFCEENKGESLLTCTADCLPFGTLALQAAQLNQLRGVVRPVPPRRTRTPTPSGIGG
jgi:hypothetical protein